MPPVRELAERFHLSINVARQVLQTLVEEGILHTVPRVGTFAGPALAPASAFYLLLLPEMPQLREYSTQIALGFEERSAQLGAASLVMPLPTALRCRQDDQMPTLVGVFDFANLPTDGPHWDPVAGVPHVVFGHSQQPGDGPDQVSFDDVNGGRLATQHLIQKGHRRIAYLALHVPGQVSEVFFWSAEREEGWRQAMAAAGLPAEELAYHPVTAVEPHPTEQTQRAAVIARALVRRPDITAVVAANDVAARGLFRALRAAHIPPDSWPAVVGFDNQPNVHNYVVTSLRLPWDEVGRTAAQLLWERHTGRLAGAPAQRQVPLRLFPRLTSRAGWPHQASSAVLVASDM